MANVDNGSVLVLGGTGFIGGYISRALAADGRAVRAAVHPVWSSNRQRMPGRLDFRLGRPTVRVPTGGVVLKEIYGEV